MPVGIIIAFVQMVTSPEEPGGFVAGKARSPRLADVFRGARCCFGNRERPSYELSVDCGRFVGIYNACSIIIVIGATMLVALNRFRTP